MRYDCLINITRKNILFAFLTLYLIIIYPAVYFSISSSKIAWSVGQLCKHRQGDVFSISRQQYR